VKSIIFQDARKGGFFRIFSLSVFLSFRAFLFGCKKNKFRVLVRKNKRFSSRFIQFDKFGKMCITNRREKAAQFSDLGKAWRVLTTQMSKKKRDG